MESIKALRKYINGTTISTWTRNYIDQHIDAIEREVEDNARFRAEAEPFHDRLCKAAEAREDVTLWGVDYTALPVDADGVPIHVGDVMEWPDGETFEVAGIGGETLFYIGNNDECEWTSIDCKRHHHAPTVEDVLREFADRVCNSGHQWGLDAADTIAEYAAKLQLKEG